MSTQLDQAMMVFKRHMPPAQSREDYDDAMPTREILNKFEELLGEENIDKKTLCELLTNNGYILDYVLDEFCWLIKTAK